MSPVVNQRCKEDGNPEYKGYSLGQAGTKIVEKTTKWYKMPKQLRLNATPHKHWDFCYFDGILGLSK